MNNNKKIRKNPHDVKFKLKAALAVIKGDKATAQLCNEFGIVSEMPRLLYHLLFCCTIFGEYYDNHKLVLSILIINH